MCPIFDLRYLERFCGYTEHFAVVWDREGATQPLSLVIYKGSFAGVSAARITPFPIEIGLTMTPRSRLNLA